MMDYVAQTVCFQFIGFPSEWGGHRCPPQEHLQAVFPIYWVPQRVGSEVGQFVELTPKSFQFIGFPSEWGVYGGAS